MAQIYRCQCAAIHECLAQIAEVGCLPGLRHNHCFQCLAVDKHTVARQSAVHVKVGSRLDLGLAHVDAHQRSIACHKAGGTYGHGKVGKGQRVPCSGKIELIGIAQVCRYVRCIHHGSFYRCFAGLGFYRQAAPIGIVLKERDYLFGYGQRNGFQVRYAVEHIGVEDRSFTACIARPVYGRQCRTIAKCAGCKRYCRGKGHFRKCHTRPECTGHRARTGELCRFAQVYLGQTPAILKCTVQTGKAAAMAQIYRCQCAAIHECLAQIAEVGCLPGLRHNHCFQCLAVDKHTVARQSAVHVKVGSRLDLGLAHVDAHQRSIACHKAGGTYGHGKVGKGQRVPCSGKIELIGIAQVCRYVRRIDRNSLRRKHACQRQSHRHGCYILIYFHCLLF